MKENNNILPQFKASENIELQIEISISEYSRLKDIETRFTIIKEQMMHAEYCPIHTQIILGIVKDCKMPDEFVIQPLLKKKLHVPTENERNKIFFDDGK